MICIPERQEGPVEPAPPPGAQARVDPQPERGGGPLSLSRADRGGQRVSHECEVGGWMGGSATE